MLAHCHTTFHSDMLVKASPANRRAVLETVAALERQGHDCVEFEVPERASGPTTATRLSSNLIVASCALEIFVGLTSADGYKKITSHLGPDPQV